MESSSRRIRRIVPWALVAFVIAGIFFGSVLWTERNTAHIESEFMVDFAEDNDLVVYCGNGYGLGLFSANENPWWEWTLLGDDGAASLANDLEPELAGEGFEVLERGVTEAGTLWITGQASGTTVNAEIATEMPQNNCFPDFDDVITDVNPADYETKAVVEFRDEARSR